jgi:hypothetical protein
MTKKIIFFSILCIVLVGLSTSPLLAEVQTTYTKSDNVVTVIAKPDANHTGQLTAFAFAFRYLGSYNLDLAVTSSTYSPAITIGTTNVDPVDAAYKITTFFLNNGVSNVSWLSGTEYPMCTITLSGGLGTTPFSLAVDSPDYIYAYTYYEFDFGNDLTNYTVPFYSGTDNLTISTVGNWIYAEQDLLLGKYWLTTGNSDWTTGTNWFGSTVPTAGQDVAIIAGGTQPIAGSGSVCNILKVEAGANVEVAFNGNLTVNGNLDIADDEGLLLESTASNTGSLITFGTVPAGNKVAVERYVAAVPNWGTNNQGFHILSSPVASQAITTSDDFTPSASGYDFYAWDEPTQTWFNEKQGHSGMFTSFEVGKGYLVAYELSDTKVFTGVLNTSEVTKSGLTRGGYSGAGWHMLGNPFQSAIQWSSVTRTNVAGTAKIWNGASYTDLSGSGIIPAANGFMVEATVTGASITVPLASRVHNATAWYKSSDQRIYLMARDIENDLSQESTIRFNSEATEGYDSEFDSHYLDGFAPMFYSSTNGEKVSTNALPSIVLNESIPFGFVKNDASNFVIELVESIESNLVFIRDLKTGITFNLSENGSYSFTSETGDSPDRFEIFFGVTGIDTQNALTAARVYVANDMLIVNNVKGNTFMDILNLQGQVLNSYSFNSSGSEEFAVNLPAGIYMVRLENSNTTKTVKVFIN